MQPWTPKKLMFCMFFFLSEVLIMSGKTFTVAFQQS